MRFGFGCWGSGFVPQIARYTYDSLLLSLDPDVGCGRISDTERKFPIAVAGKNCVDEFVLDPNVTQHGFLVWESLLTFGASCVFNKVREIQIL